MVLPILKLQSPFHIQIKGGVTPAPVPVLVSVFWPSSKPDTGTFSLVSLVLVLALVLEQAQAQELVLGQLQVMERSKLHLASSEPSLRHAPLSSGPSLPQLLPSLWHLCFPARPWQPSKSPPAS